MLRLLQALNKRFNHARQQGIEAFSIFGKVHSILTLAQDHFYICVGHLKDRGFCQPIVDEAEAAAQKKRQELEQEIEKVKKEYEEKQKRKAEKRKQKKKDDKDKKTDEKKEQKESEEVEDAQDEKEKEDKVSIIMIAMTPQGFATDRISARLKNCPRTRRNPTIVPESLLCKSELTCPLPRGLPKLSASVFHQMNESF